MFFVVFFFFKRFFLLELKGVFVGNFVRLVVLVETLIFFSFVVVIVVVVVVVVVINVPLGDVGKKDLLDFLPLVFYKRFSSFF